MTVISEITVTQRTRPRARLSQVRLGRIVANVAAHPERWREIVRYDPARRWYHRMELTDDYEVWLLSWLPGQETGFHDHGGSCGAFAAALGELQEQTVRGRAPVFGSSGFGGSGFGSSGFGGSVPSGSGAPELVARTVTPGWSRSFGARYVHNVVNNSTAPAISVHAYSPPLPEMRRYELTIVGLRYTGTEPAETTP